MHKFFMQKFFWLEKNIFHFFFIARRILVQCRNISQLRAWQSHLARLDWSERSNKSERSHLFSVVACLCSEWIVSIWRLCIIMRPRLDQRVARPRLLIQDWDQDFESQIQDRDCNFFDIIWPLPHNGVVTLLYVLYCNATFLTTAEDFIQFGVRARSLVKQTRAPPPIPLYGSTYFADQILWQPFHQLIAFMHIHPEKVGATPGMMEFSYSLGV